MFSPGSNDPRASVPPNACDSTSVLSSDGGGLWDKPSYLKDTRLENRDRDKILSGRREWADRSVIVSSQRPVCSNETGPISGKVHERHERGERERNFEGKREWSTTKSSAFPSQRALGSAFSNGSSFSTVSKRYPGRHGFYKENGRYGSTCTRAGDAPHFAALTDDNNGGKIERDLYYGVAEATTGSSDINMCHATKDLESPTNKRACLLSGDRMQDGCTQIGELKDGSIFHCNSPRKGERDNICDSAELRKIAGTFQDNVLQGKNVVDKVVLEGRLGLRLNHLDSCSEDSFVSNSTLGSTLKQNSERSLERVAPAASRRSAFAVGNGFSNDLIARSHTSLDTSLLSPRSSSHSAVLASALGATLSGDKSSPRKRPRLGWGQGLAKYEQKKVEGNISSSVSNCGGNFEFEAPPSLCTDDERTALKANGRFPSTTSSSWHPDLVIERLSESEVCGGSSIKGESCYQSSEEAKAYIGDLRISQQSGTLQEKSAVEKLKKVESSQVQLEQVSTYKSLELLVIDKCSGVARDSPRRTDIDEPPASIEDVVEANHLAPKDLSSWTKQEILAGIEKLELEIDLVEKEILKLDIDAGDDLQNASAPISTMGVDENTEEIGCTTVENLEEPHLFEETSFQQPVDDHQTLQTSPWEVSSDFQMEEPQPEAENPSMRPVESEVVGKMTPEIEKSTIAAQEGVIETGCGDLNNCAGLEFLSGSQEPLPSVDVLENDVLLDMQKLHLQSVHALLEENQIQSRLASRPFIHLLPERLPDVESQRLELNQDVRVWERSGCDNDGCKEQMLEKLAKHKQFIRFKEQVLALKYRALKELWKQEQLGNSQKKDRSKTFRKSESERKNGTASVTQRFSLRLRPTLSASGRMDAAPDEVKVMSKVLADRSDEHVRPFLRMPAMVLDDKERVFRKFLSKNGLVEDPLSLEQERETMNPWTSEERQIFLDKFAAFNKNFSKIASYLQHKTTADCVVFYYRNHKSEDFEKIRRRHQLKKRRDCSRASASYLATTVLPAGVRNCEGNLARVEDITAFTHTNSSSREVLRPGRAISHKSMERSHFGGPTELRSCISGALIKSTGAKESKAASNLLAVAAGVASGAAMSPCSLSTSVFPSKSGIDSNMFGENLLGQISFRSSMGALGDFKASHFLHDRQGAGKSVGEQLESQWNDNEKHSFVDALGLYGKDFRRIAQHVKTKTQGQCKAFFSKSRKRLNLDQIVNRFQTSSQTLLEAEVDAIQPTSNLKTVKVEEFVACANAVVSPKDVQLGETITTCVEATTEESEHPVLEPLIMTDDMKAPSGDEGIRASLIGFVLKDSLHHTSASSPGRQKAEYPVEMAESTGMPNELQCSQAVCESSPVIAESDVDVNHNKDVCVLGSEGCSCSPTKAGESLKTQLTESAMHREEAMEIATTSCTASSGVVVNEHENISKRPKLEADSPSISSSVPPEIPSSQSVPHQVSHAPRPSNATIAIKNSQLYERTVKTGGETRNRREATSWAQDEKEIFAETIKKHGKDWAVLRESLPSKSLTQIKTYFQNSKAKLGYALDNTGSGSSQAICSRKRKADDSDTHIKMGGKLCSQKDGQSIVSDGGLNANSGDVNPNVNVTVVGAEQLAYAMLARNAGQVVEDIAVVNDMQMLFRKIGSNGLTTQTAAASKQVSASGISESTPSSGHFLGSMQSQLLSNSLYASIQQQLLSACKQPPASSNNSQQQLSVPQLPVQQHQLAQSASKQQLAHGLHQQQVLSLTQPVMQSQQLSQSACQQQIFSHHPQPFMPVQVQASSILNQKLAHQSSQQQSSSPLVALNNQQFFNQVAHRFQQHVAHQQQQKQIIQPQQQQLQQVAHQQVQNTMSPLMVLQPEPSDGATHLHKQVIVPCHQQPAPHHTSNLQQPLTKQQQHCQLLNQQKVVDQQQLFVQQQQQQLAFKHQQQVLIQQQSQVHQTQLSQMVQHQHQFLHQQQLKKIALQQQLNALNQSQDHQNEKFTLQMLQHGLQLKANQQLLQQKDVQVPHFEESATIAKQLNTTRLDQQQCQTRPTAASVKGSLKRLGSGSDMLNPADVELRRLQVPQLSPEDSQSSQPDSDVSLRGHSRGETCSDAQPGRSGDVKLFGQSLLSQPSSSGSKSSSASPTGNGRFLLRPFSPSLLASPASVPVSSMLPPPKFLGSDSATSSSLDKEVHHSPGSRTHQPGNSFTTNMANGLQKVTVPRTGVLESHSVQEAVAYMTHRLVQNRGPEHGTHGESSTASGPHTEYHRGSQEPCRDEKSLSTIHGPFQGRGEQNSVTFHSRGVASQVDTEMDNEYVRVDELCTPASKIGGQATYPLMNQGLSRGVLDAIMAITTRQNVQGSVYAGGSTRVEDHGLLRSFVNGLELPKGSGMAEVPNSVGQSYVGGPDILQHILHNYLSMPQVLNVSRQTVPDDNACITASGSHLTITDRMELVPKHLPATQSTVEEPLRSSETQEVNSSGSIR
ncbi:hypothetical protein O6H91_21G012000 [Diphasiastrum complanatum]|uniref:Uncharacterized protein n=4 Tax=Diphasiastrum complanatum TaxID=34168 RepID=A0ACC2AI81_DIPCM|nr:hypothetical protein O6H91_21G012000 [Diphasiastrum complanatum]KAJ7517146.1 hypothetical protein O6H91_21G012000 [Diphasiastrum complanatum]KAJ7517147.1 hypothetical protein O6H91_21G012000 [Diphasiastrum complanatum]KAJ7517148.1 hypothetical protein O6H91_21G012000 [Diphasiastrum complanatum]